jgi:REP element-mobilizing transposase RayT
MRQFFPDIFYFITTSTVDHCHFFNTDAKKNILLESILLAQSKFNLKNFDFSLLDNHYHLISFFEDSNIIPQVIKQINGRSGKLLNQFENVKNRKIWSDYHIYYIGHESVYYKVRGYVIGNAYKHSKISSLQALSSYPYSTYGNIVKELGQEQAEDMVLSGVKMSEQDFIKEIKLIQ